MPRLHRRSYPHDAQVFWDTLATPASLHGVTTPVMGNCGFTSPGVPWGWRSLAEYFDVVDRRPKSVNLPGYIGNSALRTFVMGERGNGTYKEVTTF